MKDAISKVVNYLKAFSERQRECLAIYTSLCISEGEDGSTVVYLMEFLLAIGIFVVRIVLE